MDIQTRRHVIRDQENVYAGKGGNGKAVGLRPTGRSTRALGDLNSNLQIQRQVGKVAVAAAEFEKKACQNRAPLRSFSNYGHVQSKIDTGLCAKMVQPSARPPLRREESTAGLAARAAARTRAALKDTTNKATKLKDISENLPQLKKPVQEKEKKILKLPSITSSDTKEKEIKVHKDSKATIKDSTESLGKLKLADSKSDIYIELKDKEDQSVELPADIEDIDAADKNSPLLMSIYIKDIYKYLTELEEIYPIEPDYLKRQNVITGKMRATLIDWLVDVQRQFSLVLETFQLTVGILDRYLQTVPNVKRDRLQLIGVTAMYIASKYEEIYAPDVGDFVYVTDNAYSKQDVFRCEREMLQKLGFCLARPIPLSFLRRFVKAAHGTSKHHHLAKYLVDLCLVEYSMAHHRPSQLAAAAICLSLHLLSNKDLEVVWTPTLAYYSEYTLDQIKPIITQIAKVVLNVETSKYKAVFHKYQDISLARVSSLPHLKGESIQKLANTPETPTD